MMQVSNNIKYKKVFQELIIPLKLNEKLKNDFNRLNLLTNFINLDRKQNNLSIN